MKYYYQIEGYLKNNLGDVIQGLAAKEYLPEEAIAIDRERPDLVSPDPGFLLANGWYQHNFDFYPPPKNIIPFFISVHIAKSDFLKINRVRNYFKENSPIGCRDSKTMWLLRGFGIPAYYSGCLTLTLNSQIKKPITKESVLWVDNFDHPIPSEIDHKMKILIPQGIVKINHNPVSTSSPFSEYNFANTNLALQLLNTYKSASLVLTNKIHCALPCIALGIPVILIHPNPLDPRLELLHNLIRVYSYEQFLKLKKLPKPILRNRKLIAIQKKLRYLSIIAVKEKSNPFNNNKYPKLIRQKKHLKLISMLCSYTLKSLWKIGVKRKKLERVFGKEFLSEKN